MTLLDGHMFLNLRQKPGQNGKPSLDTFLAFNCFVVQGFNNSLGDPCA